MELLASDARLITDFIRKATKAASVEAVIAQAFKTLKSMLNTKETRIIYSSTPSTWSEWKASAETVGVRVHDDWPAPARRAQTVFFDPKKKSAGYVSVVAAGRKPGAALTVIAAEIWSALLLQSALARVQHSAISEAELVHETLRARDEERRHIARELHDDLGQSMASLQLSLKWAEGRLSSRQGTEEIVQTMSEVRQGISLMLTKVRDLSHILYPRVLDTLGFVAALKELAHETSRHSGIAVECTSRGKPRELEKEAAVALYRCCQEAISNAIWHARASTLRIQVHFARGETRVAVQDDGSGFDPRILFDSSTRTMTSGLWTIRQRMGDLGGTFRVSTAEGDGTVVEFTVPYSTRNADAQRKNKTADRG
jgi:signal transduction histidine kinase